MPTGSQGQNCFSGVIGNALHVMRIATGAITKDLRDPPNKIQNGILGMKVRAERLTQEDRTTIAKKAASGRWG